LPASLPRWPGLRRRRPPAARRGRRGRPRKGDRVSPTARRRPPRAGTGSRPGTATRSRPRAEVTVVRTGPTAESLLIGSVAVLCLLGLVMVYSASSVASVHSGEANWGVVARQFGFMVVGLGLAVGAARLPLRFLRDRVPG